MPKTGRVPEAQQADIADEQVEGAGEEREAQQLHQEDGVEEEGADREEGDQQDEGDDLRLGEAEESRPDLVAEGRCR
jgi:hypothetical protein